jgi:peptidyl-prolyl cis-trans isomerase C
MKRMSLPLLAGLVLIAGCTPKGATEGTGKPVATVNGTAISHEFFEFFSKTVAGKPSAELSPEQRSQVLDALVRAELSAQAAEKAGLGKQGDSAYQLEIARLQILQDALFTGYLKDHKASDAELKAEYDAQVAQMAKTQYHAHHILVATKDEADQVIAQLKKGAKFETLAGQKSTDPGSKAKGGDLDWFNGAQMVKPFTDAVAALKKGEVTATPVQTNFGWHVIRLDDTREVAPPAFETVKDRIVQIVDNKKVKAYGEELTRAAKIEKDAAATAPVATAPAPAAAAPAAPAEPTKAP